MDLKETLACVYRASSKTLRVRPLLPCLKEKAFSEFQQEMFELADDGKFQVGFGISGLFIQPEKFQNVGIFKQVLRPGDNLPPAGQFAGLPCRGSKPAARTGRNQTGASSPAGPVLLPGFNLIEISFNGIFDAQQKDIV